MPCDMIATEINEELCRIGALTREGDQLKCSHILNMLSPDINSEISRKDLG